MKKALSIVLCFVLMTSICAYAAPPSDLTWDGNAATLAEIAKNTGYDMVDANGNYKPLYHYYASELWKNGLFLGSGGSFDLDKPLTRAEGVVMTIRLLGKETESKATTTPITFTDVPDWAKPYIAYAAQNGIANGYSQTAFGANDPMTAAQFITLVLRAMGYQDGTDFTWDSSYNKALEIGLIGQPCHAQYSRSNLFMRDNAAVIAYNAVFTTPMKLGNMLKDSISMPGQPSGATPTATRPDTVEPPPQTGSSDVTISTLPGIYIDYTNIQGMLVAGKATYLFTPETSGAISITGTVNGVSDSATLTDAEAGKTYAAVFIFGIENKPNYNVTNTFTINMNGSAYTDTITISGTITSVSIEGLYNYSGAPSSANREKYIGFDVPRYDTINSTAMRVADAEKSDRLFLKYYDYSSGGYKIGEYIDLLKTDGFSSNGTVEYGGASFDWYAKGNLHVVFGEAKGAFIVRVYKGEVDTTSTDGLNRFYAIINS